MSDVNKEHVAYLNPLFVEFLSKRGDIEARFGNYMLELNVCVNGTDVVFTVPANHGVCFLVGEYCDALENAGVIGADVQRAIFSQYRNIMSTWPHKVDDTYVVPYSIGNTSVTEAESVFDEYLEHEKNMFGTGQYGQNRWALVEYVAAEVESALSMESSNES